MKDSRPLELCSGGRLFIYFFRGAEAKGGATDATDRALNLPGCPLRYFSDIPGYTKNPMSFDMGFSVQK